MPDTLSSMATGSSAGWADLVALGRKLTHQLGDAADDLACSWMAQHVARLMSEAEAEQGEDVERRREQCRIAILDLWKVRHAIMDRAPFHAIEEVGTAVRALHNGDDWFFRRIADENSAARPLQLAYAVDKGARAIIRALVGDAVRAGLSEEREWLALVRTGVLGMEPLFVVLEEMETDVTPQEARVLGPGSVRSDAALIARKSKLQAEREAMIERLQLFASLADEIANQLKVPTPSRERDDMPTGEA